MMKYLGRFMFGLGERIAYLVAKFRLGYSMYVRNDAVNEQLCVPIRWRGE